MAALPFPARLYFSMLALTALGLMAALIAGAPPPGLDTLLQAVVATALMAVAWLYPLPLAFKQRLYLDTSVLIAVVVLLPPGLAMGVAGTGTLLAHIIRRQEWVQSTFNAAQIMMQAALGGLILAAFDDRIPHRPQAIGYVLLAAVVMYAANLLLVATMVALQSSRSPVSLWRQVLVDVSGLELLGYLTQVGVGALAVFLLEAAPWLVPVLLVPTVAVYLELHGRIRRRQEAEAARRDERAGPVEAQRVALLGTWQWNLTTGDSTWSEGTFQLLGTRRGMTEPSFEALLRSVHPEDRVMVNRAVHDALRSTEPFQINHRIVLPDGTERIVDHRGETVADAEGGGSRLVATVQDVTERRILEAQLAWHALHDPETGLPNRAFVLDHVAELMARRPLDQVPVAVVLVDIEGAGAEVLHATGEHGGSDVLLEVVRRLRACAREGEVVARIGRTRFMLVFGVGAADIAETRAAGVRDALRVPLAIDGQHVPLDVRVGVAISSQTVKLPLDLMRAAESAVERAGAGVDASRKAPGADTHRVRVSEAELRWALERHELRLYYQPEVTLATGQIVGFEATIRWRHPTGGWLLPHDFLPMAEVCHLGPVIGRWVLREACRSASAWSTSAAPDHRLTVSVNVSRQHFRDHHFVSDVTSALEQAGLDATRLRLELTESIVVEDLDASSQIMEALHNLGVRFAIDDYGAGYASLGYLHRLPIEVLKLDRLLTAALETGEPDRAIVQSTASLARTFGLRVFAKGIETPLQLAWADALGCAQGQGYFFSPPLDSGQLARLLGRAMSFDGSSPAPRPSVPV